MAWEPFISTLTNHWDGILAYFDERRTSGPVEGINTKVRVVLRRRYGMRNIATLWTRLFLDVNWAWKKIGNTIAAVRALVVRSQGHFARCYTLKRENWVHNSFSTPPTPPLAKRGVDAGETVFPHSAEKLAR